MIGQKALKTLAARNTATLNRTHIITIAIHSLFLLIHLILRRRGLLAWFLVSLPSFIVELWFERIARPTYSNGDLKRAGEDLEAKGLTEWLWDILYWTWGCVLLAIVFGNKAWWLYLAVPMYSAYLAFTTFTGARQSLAGLGGAGDAGATAGAQSKRQAKMEKRGGQKVQSR